MLRLYAITKRGKDISGNIVARDDDQTRILQYLHESRGTTEEISDWLKIPKPRVSSILNRLERKGLVIELTKKDRQERYG